MKTPGQIWFLRMVVLCLLGSQTLGIAVETNSVSALYLIRRNGWFGYVDHQGREVIKPQFIQARGFKEGMACVKVEGKMGFINTDGKLVVQPQYLAAEDFSEGLASVVPTNGLIGWGYLDLKGTVVIPPRFECRWAEDSEMANPEGRFSQGLAFVREIESRDSGYIDKSGRFVIRGDFEVGYPFSEGMAFVITSQYNRKGDYVGRKRGYIDKAGALVITGEFEYGGRFSDGLAAVTIHGRTGFIDRNGKSVIPAKYPFNARPDYGFSEGLAWIIDAQGRYGFIDHTGKVVISPQFARVEDFSDGLAPVMEGKPYQVGGKWGYIDSNGKWVIPPAFMRVGPFSNGFATINVGGQWDVHVPMMSLKDSKSALIDKMGKFVWSSSE